MPQEHQKKATKLSLLLRDYIRCKKHYKKLYHKYLLKSIFSKK